VTPGHTRYTAAKPCDPPPPAAITSGENIPYIVKGTPSARRRPSLGRIWTYRRSA